MIKELSEIQSLHTRIKQEKPLIHCITNPISIHDCANIILAAGARPIMAEHPKEVVEITAGAKALMLNLGNITDARMESMTLSIRKAQELGIPVLLDLVGVACSHLRYRFAKKLLAIGSVSVLKGNMSEILTMAGLSSHSIGVDAGEEDALTKENLSLICEAFGGIAEKHNTVIMATGKKDLITDGERVFFAENGNERLSQITGTGCQAGALATAFLPGADPLEAAILGTVVLGIAGENAAEHSKGPGSFQAELLDAVYNLDNYELAQKIRVTPYGKENYEA